MSVIADDHQVAVLGAQRAENLGLQRVRVLILVDQDMLELGRCVLTGGCLAESAPEEEQVVVIQDVLCPLAARVLAENRADAAGVLGAPREGVLQHG